MKESEEGVQEVACEAPFTAVGDMCLTFLTQEHMSWEEAVGTCTLLGGHLAMFDDIEMLRSIYLHIHDQAIESKSFWLAGSDMITEGTWLWTNGNSVPMGMLSLTYLGRFCAGTLHTLIFVIYKIYSSRVTVKRCNK
nr:galactose-specific lectin nattectin-like [Procambarus clarkii]